MFFSETKQFQGQPDANAVWKVNVPRLVQSWNRFILQQIFTQCSASYDKNVPEDGMVAAWRC